MKAHSLSIRRILLLILGVLTVLIALQAGYAVHREWQRMVRVESLKDASRLSDKLFSAIEKLSIERDVAVTLMRTSDNELATQLRLRLTESRQETDEAMRVALHAFHAYQFQELVPLQERITAKLSDIASLREQVERAIALPLPERDPSLAVRWYEEISTLLAVTDELWSAFIGHFTDINPVVTQHLRYKHLLRIITNYTGRERAIIGRLIVENASPTPEEFAELLRGQGIIEMSWKLNHMIGVQSGLYPSVASQYTDAQSHYQNLYGMIRDIFYLPGAKHTGTYPIGADLWLELSEQASESLGILKDASIEATGNYIGKLEEDARRTILLQSTFMLFALGFCAYSFRVLVRRVLSPIGQMVAALLDTMQGRAVTVPPQTLSQDDEIGKLAKVLHAFRQNVEQIRQATARAVASENKTRAVVDNAINGIITINERGTIESFNPACERLFGYTAAEVMGRNVKMLMPEPYHSEHDGYLSRYVSTGDARIIGTAGREVAARRKDGSVFPMELSVSVFELEDGRHFSGIINDISARKQAEDNIRAYMNALERSNKELDDFAYIASHDLKEPLRGIHNHARFLLEDNEDKLDEESVKKLNRLVYLSQRMERLVNDLLYFSRLGRQELAVQPTDLNEVVHDIENTLEQFLHERHARIVVPAVLPTIICDNTRVTELLRNLITNAVKYNDRDDKVIEIGFLPRHASPRHGELSNVFYVRDNGRGIAPEFSEEVFRIFKRLQNNKGAEEGTGVGLTFVKKIVERHGGRIWLESELGEGTVFYFTLEASHA